MTALAASRETMQKERSASLSRMLLALILFGIAALCNAQETRSINGRKYIVHHVEQGQTLYAIARAHAVAVNDLLQANPEAANGLSIGQEILIPQESIVKKDARTAPELMAHGELRHTVARKETLFGIARKYGVDINDLMERNGGITGGLHEGMELVVPMKKVTGVDERALQPAEPVHYVEHTVLPGETLFAIGKAYGITADEVSRANGGLPDGLKAGSIIRIPRRGEQETVVAPPPPEQAVPGQLHHVGLLLPFSTSRNDSVIEHTAQDPAGASFYEASRIAAQFYAGARMALDSMERLGLRADVTVVDVGDDPRSWSAALKSPAVVKLELSIGPFHRSAIEQLARAQPRTRIVCPVPQSNKIVLGLPNVIKTSTSRSDLVKHAARFVAARHAADNIILLRPDIAGEKELQGQVLAALNATLAAQPSRARDSVLAINSGRRDIGELVSKLVANRVNVVVAPSDDVEFVTSLVGKLKPQADKHAIVLVGLQGWLEMAPVAAEDLDRLGFCFAAPSFFDPEDARVQDFTARYRDRFHQDVDEYALLGFDVTFHQMKALMQGSEPGAESSSDEQPLHMGFRMGRTGPENGLRNEYAVMLQVKDMRLQRAQ